MTGRLFIYFFPLVLLLGSGVSSAQSASLAEVLRLSADTHPSVTSRRSEVDAAQKAVSGAEWGRFPAFGVASSATQSGDTIASAQLQQPLWAGGRITAEIDGAEARLKAAQARLTESQRDIMIKSASAYAEVLRTGKRLAAAESNVAEHTRLYDMIKRRVDSEVSPSIDETLAMARLQQAIAEKMQIESLLANAESALSQTIGQQIKKAQLKPQEPLPVSFGSVEQVRVAAIDTSPVLERLAADELGAEADIDSRRAAFWPKVSAKVERIFGGKDSEVVDRTRNLLVVEFQPGAGLSAMSGVEGAIARRDAARSTKEASRRDILEQVTSQWNEIISLRGQIRPLRDLDARSAEVVDSYIRQYSVGRKNWLDVLNAQRELTQARFSLADAEASLLLSTVKLNINTGLLTASNVGQFVGAVPPPGEYGVGQALPPQPAVNAR